MFYSVVSQLPFELYYERVPKGSVALVSVYPRPLGSPHWVRTNVPMAGPSDADLASAAAHFKRLWVVLAHDVNPAYGWDSADVLARVEKHFALREDRRFEWIRVLLYE
jgi:hypothetical protein